MTLLVVALMAAAGWFAAPAAGGLGRLGVRRRQRDWRPAGRPTTSWFLLLGLVVAGITLSVAGIAGLGLIVVAGGAVASVGALLRRSRRRADQRRRRREVLEFCDGLAAELRAGQPVVVALQAACGGMPELAVVATAVRFGGGVADALRGCAGRPGAEGLRAVAVAWEVAAGSGAALAGVLDRVAAALRAEEDARSEVEAALAPPRATAKLLAVLPAFGLLLGTSMGARPVDFLLGSGIGAACLAVGVGLVVAGVVWVERIAAAAEA